MACTNRTPVSRKSLTRLVIECLRLWILLLDKLKLHIAILDVKLRAHHSDMCDYVENFIARKIRCNYRRFQFNNQMV